MSIGSIILGVGKEFLANKAADKLGNKESKSTETPSTKLDVDESPTIDMSDKYEATSYDSNDDDPGFVDIDIPDTEQLELDNPEVVDIPNDIPDVTPIDEVELPGEQEVIEDETIPVDIEPTQESSGDLNTDTSTPLTGNTTNGSFNAGSPIGSSFMPSIEGANSPVELPQIQQSNTNNIPSTDADTDVTVSSDPNELVQAMYEGDPVKTEEYIEQNPEESIDILKDGTDIDTEARQVIDGNPRNVEVKDEAVEEALKDPGSFINEDKIGLLSSNDEFNEAYGTLDKIINQPPSEPKETKVVDYIEQKIGKEMPADIKADVEKEAKFVSEINDDFFKDFVESWKAEDDKITDDYRANHPDDINYPALQDWADSVKDDDDSDTRAVAYSLDDVKDAKDLNSYRWAQQKKYDKAQAKLNEASDLMKKAREGDEFNNDYRKAAGQMSFPAGAARARAQKNINVANALQNTEMDDATFAAALKDKQLIRDLKGMEDEQDRLERVSMFIDEYRTAVANKDGKKAEQLIEEDPETAVEALPEGTNAHKEAAQIFDGDTRTNEVNNERLSEDFDRSIDWDNVNVYGPEENHSKWENEPDFDTSDWTADMGENPLPEGERPNFHEGDEAIDRMQERMSHDEDFAGPDELPATYEQIVDPGKELALTDGNQLAPIENAEDAGFSWEIIDSQIDEDVDNDETIPEEEKEETKERRHRIVAWLSKSIPTATGNGSDIANTEPTTDNALLRTGFGPSVGIGNLMRASGNVSGGHMDKVGHDELHGRKPAAMGTTPNVTGVVEDNFGKAAKIKSNVNASKPSAVTRTNGALSTSSGGLMSTRKKSGEFKSDKIKLASGESRSNKKAITPEDLNVANVLVNRLKMMVSKMSPLIRKQLGFSPVLYQYKGTAIDKLPPEVVNKLIEVIEENGLAQ